MSDLTLAEDDHTGAPCPAEQTLSELRAMAPRAAPGLVEWLRNELAALDTAVSLLRRFPRATSDQTSDALSFAVGVGLARENDQFLRDYDKGVTPAKPADDQEERQPIFPAEWLETAGVAATGRFGDAKVGAAPSDKV